MEKVNHIYIVNEIGKLIFANGDKYVGQWRDDKKNGNGKSQNIVNTIGKLNFSNGDKYDGEWKDDKKIGKGKSYL